MGKVYESRSVFDQMAIECQALIMRGKTDKNGTTQISTKKYYSLRRNALTEDLKLFVPKSKNVWLCNFPKLSHQDCNRIHNILTAHNPAYTGISSHSIAIESMSHYFRRIKLFAESNNRNHFTNFTQQQIEFAWSRIIHETLGSTCRSDRYYYFMKG